MSDDTTTDISARNVMVKAMAPLGDSGFVRIYAGNNALLAELGLGNPAFKEPDGDTLHANDIAPDTNATATGTATKYKVVQANGTTIWGGPVVLKRKGPPQRNALVLDSIAIQFGAEVSITSLIYSLPA